MTFRSMVTTAMALGAIAATSTLIGAGQANPNKAKLLTPSQLTEKAPDRFKAKLDTSQGVVVIDVHRDWAPLGADRDRKSTRLNSSHSDRSRMPSSA